MIPRTLEPREVEVLTHLANGKTTDEICALMKLHKSVILDMKRIATRKLGAVNRINAVAIAVELGLVNVGNRGL